MELKDTILQRHSIRHFTDKSISLYQIHEMIKFANLAPSAGNLQSRDFIIIDDIEVKRKLSAAALNQEFIIEAPVNIVVCANLRRISIYGYRGKELYCIQDSAAAIEHILLLAVDNGLGSCWVGAFDENKVSKILNLPSYVRPVAIIPVGYASSKANSISRINDRLLTHYNSW
jgi:nitroreductase